jgi:glycosyltransferase involved in cell wall biosynthesis
VVASAVGGIPEQLPDSPQAELVPPGDAVAVGRALLRLRENPPSDAERLVLREHIVSARRLPVIVRSYRSTLSEKA